MWERVRQRSIYNIFFQYIPGGPCLDVQSLGLSTPAGTDSWAAGENGGSHGRPIRGEDKGGDH